MKFAKGIVGGVQTSYMFSNCKNLKTLSGIEKLDMSNVEAASYMFYECSSLTSLDLSGWNTSSLNNIVSFLSGCSSLTSLNISNLNVSNVEDMALAFSNCSSLTSLDLTGWSTSKVKKFDSMFSGGTMLTSVAIGPSFDMSGAADSTYASNKNTGIVARDKSSRNTTNGIVLMSDADFFTLTTAERQGV